MKNVKTSYFNFIFILISGSSLVSCGGGSDKGVSATTRGGPTIASAATQVSGVVMLGPVINADVSVYEITVDSSAKPSTFKRIFLNSTSQQTNSLGEYSVTIKPTAEITPILVCASNGQYIEPASTALTVPVEKIFSANDELCAITMIKRNEKLAVNLTYFTHLAYGLASNQILINGASLLDVKRTNQDGTSSLLLGGISNSNKIVSDWLQLSTTLPINQGVITIKPQDITNSAISSANTGLTDEFKYGLANAAISDLVEWIRLISPTTQSNQPFDKVSSIQLAQKVFSDIADGELDGTNNAAQLFLSDTALKGHILRYHFAFKLLVVNANKAINRTGLTNSDITSFVDAVNKNSALFPTTALTLIDSAVPLFSNGPVFAHGFPTKNGVIVGNVTIRIDIADIVDIDRVEMTFDTVPAGGFAGLPTNLATLTPNKPEWAINTVSESTAANPGIPDGIYDITLVATNRNGVSATRVISNIRVSNKPIHLHITNPPKITDLTLPVPKNPRNSLAGFAAVINDIFFLEDTGNSKVEFKILSADPASTFTPLVIPLQATPYTDITTISRKYFATDLSVDNSQVIPDGKYKLQVSASSGKNVVPPINAIPELVDFEYDTQIPTVSFATPAFQVFTGDAVIAMNFDDPLRDGNKTDIKTKILTHDGLAGEVVVGIIGNQSIFNFNVEGWHVLTVKANDYAGNNAIPQTLDVAYDKTPPTVTIFGKNNITSKWWSSLDIQSSVTDNQSGILSVYNSIDSQVPNDGTLVYDGLSTEPNTKKLFDNVDTKIQDNVTSDGIYSYTVWASDFTNDPLFTQSDQILNFGIDTTAPLITFTQENILQTPFSATPVWIDVTGNSAVSFDTANTTATMNWSFSATVEEKGYIDHTTPVSIAGVASGVAAVDIGNNSQTVLKADAAAFSIPNGTKIVTVPSLPQYKIESSASVTEIWTVIATCPAASAGGVISIINSACTETGGTLAQPAIRNAVYNWTTQVPRATPILADTVIPDTAVMSDSAQSSISIIAMDRSAIFNTTGLSGNHSKSFVCLNFRVSNVTPLATPPRSDALILADSGLATILPTIGTNTQSPTVAPIVCEEAAAAALPPWNGTALIPVLDITKAGTAPNASTVVCTIKATSKGIIAPLPLPVTSVYKVEMQLSPQTTADPTSTAPLVCPAVI